MAGGPPLDALEQALYDRRFADGEELVHHSDRGVQYVSIRYTERLAEAGIEPSVGSVGDSYDNALASAPIATRVTQRLLNHRIPQGSLVSPSYLEAIGFGTVGIGSGGVTCSVPTIKMRQRLR